MPETPPPDTPDLDAAIEERPRCARRLTRLLGDECRVVRRAIDAVRPLLPAVTLSMGLLSGCVTVGDLGTWWENPTVALATPAAWRCDKETKVPGRSMSLGNNSVPAVRS
jgi:hypothetical protein